MTHCPARSSDIPRWLIMATVGTAILCAATGCSKSHRTPAPPRPQATDTPRDMPVAIAPSPAPAAPLPIPRPGKVVSLFDGKTLTGWRVLKDNGFIGHAEVRVQDGAIILQRGGMQTGIGWNGDFPKDNYELSVYANRVEGSDFFCGLTFPVGDEHCTLIVGGWGGCIVGLSNVDQMHAAENVTTTGAQFAMNRWYLIRLRVTPASIAAWIDREQVILLERSGHQFSVWWEQEPARPFGIATYDTTAALRNIELRVLE